MNSVDFRGFMFASTLMHFRYIRTTRTFLSRPLICGVKTFTCSLLSPFPSEMRNRGASFTCMVCCVVVLCRPSVTVECIKGEGDRNAYEAHPPLNVLSQSLYASSLFYGRHHSDIGEEHGQFEPPAQEELRQQDAPSATFADLAPSSDGACTSFVETGEPPENDVSCFPHDQNVGCRSPTVNQVKTDTVQACLRQCRATEDCSHYTWNRITKDCQLKNGIPDLETVEGAMTGPRSCKSSCYFKCLTYGAEPWKTLQYPNQQPQMCHAACWVKSNSCVAWTFDKGVCKLFTQGFSAYRVTGSDTTVTGPKKNCEMKPELRLVELNDGHSLGSCLKSDDIGSSTEVVGQPSATTDIHECQRRCASNNSCTHYTYNHGEGMCSMKSGTASYYRNKGDSTGGKDCVPG